MKHLKGLIAAPFTPFTEAGAIDISLIEKQADNLVADGVSGAYVSGSTGEGISCTVPERIEVMEAWQAASKGRLTLIAHTGSNAVEETEILSREAVRLHYDAFSTIAPPFFRPDNEERLAEYCAAVAAFAPELPFYYYHTMKTAANYSMSRLLSFVDGKVPNFAGIKYNHHDLYEFQKCRNFRDGKYDIVFGVDEFFAGALALGAEGFIGSTYNYSANLYFDILKAFQAGDWTRVRFLMKQVCDGVDLLVRYGGIPAGKAMMLLKGIDCGPSRMPLRRLSPAERSAIADAMAEILARH